MPSSKDLHQEVLIVRGWLLSWHTAGLGCSILYQCQGNVVDGKPSPWLRAAFMPASTPLNFLADARRNHPEARREMQITGTTTSADGGGCMWSADKVTQKVKPMLKLSKSKSA